MMMYFFDTWSLTTMPTGHDVALICKFDSMKLAGKAVMMIDVEIVPDESMAPLDAVTEKNSTMAVNSTLGNRSPLNESP